MTSAAIDLHALAASGQKWRPTTLPGSSPEVALHRLHLDVATRATVSLVRFPPGWQRPVTGHYDVGEEFVLLAGDLALSGTAYGAGDWAWLPPGIERSASESVSGALALALFTGVPSWSVGPAGHDAAAGLTQHVGPPRVLRPDEGEGWTEVVAVAPARAGDVTLDVLWPKLATWTLAAPGESLPAHPGPAVVRHWPDDAPAAESRN